jgi:hypothetical protein
MELVCSLTVRGRPSVDVQWIAESSHFGYLIREWNNLDILLSAYGSHIHIVSACLC